MAGFTSLDSEITLHMMNMLSMEFCNLLQSHTSMVNLRYKTWSCWKLDSMKGKGSLAMSAVHREYYYECCHYIQNDVAVQVSNGM